MEKCWFKLRQPDFTPEDENAMGTGRETSPLCLGHFISSLKKLDFVLNKGEIEEFPVNMPVFSTETLHFKWHDANTNTTGGGLGAGAPIAALAGLVLKASIKTIFKKNIENWEEYERLDTYIFQPDRSYVEDCLEGKKLATEVKVLENVVIEEENKTENSGKEEGEVARNNKLAKEIGGKKAWSMFLITGIKVARKGKKTTAESNKTIIKGDIKVSVLSSRLPFLFVSLFFIFFLLAPHVCFLYISDLAVLITIIAGMCPQPPLAMVMLTTPAVIYRSLEVRVSRISFGLFA